MRTSRWRYPPARWRGGRPHERSECGRGGGTILAPSQQKSPHPARFARHPPRQRAGGKRIPRHQQMCASLSALRGEGRGEGLSPRTRCWENPLTRCFAATSPRSEVGYTRLQLFKLAEVGNIRLRRGEREVVAPTNASSPASNR